MAVIRKDVSYSRIISGASVRVLLPVFSFPRFRDVSRLFHALGKGRLNCRAKDTYFQIYLGRGEAAITKRPPKYSHSNKIVYFSHMYQSRGGQQWFKIDKLLCFPEFFRDPCFLYGIFSQAVVCVSPGIREKSSVRVKKV